MSYFFTQCPQLFCVHPAPYSFHIVPVSHDPVFHWVFDLEQPASLLRFPPDENVPFERACHDAYMLRPTDTGLDGAKSVGAGTRRGASLTVKTHKDGKKHFG